MTKLDPTHEVISCPKCAQRVQRRTWDGWTETHDCQPRCLDCAHKRYQHSPVCGGNPGDEAPCYCPRWNGPASPQLSFDLKAAR